MARTTPIGVTTVSGSSTLWEVFYLDSLSFIQSQIGGPSTPWTNGTIGGQQYLVPLDAYKNLEVGPGNTYNSSSGGFDGGLALYAGNYDNAIHEFLYSPEQGWSEGFVFPGCKGYAGFSVYRNGSVAIMNLVNSLGYLEFWWKNYDTTAPGYDPSTLNIWNQGSGNLTGTLSQGS